MSWLTRKRPSPAFVLAAIALFVSLGGVSYGVATGSIDSRELKNNTIRTKDLRNNDVRSTDIRNNTILGRDIRTGTIRGTDLGTNSVTGTDINESTLGLVPGANQANFATSAGTASSANSASSYAGLRPVKIGNSPLVLSGGQTREILRHGPFVFTAECILDEDVDPGAPEELEDRVRITVDTSADNASVDADDDDDDFDAADGTEDMAGTTTNSVAGASNAGTPAFDHEDAGVAVGADGSEVFAILYVGVNTAGQANTCRFGGYFELS